MWMTDMRIEKDLKIKEVLPVIKEVAPLYDGPLHSKVERPDDYGIELSHRVKTHVCEHFGFEASKPRRRDFRTLPYRIQGRLEKDEYDRLQIAIREDGFDTIQNFLRDAVRRYLSERTKGAKQ